jgi:two-component system phosphate regulon response regulator PhoB
MDPTMIHRLETTVKLGFRPAPSVAESCPSSGVEPMSSETILVIEDESDILEVLEYNLIREGYHVVCGSDGARAVDLVREHKPHLVLLDLMLPGKAGVEICREIRRDSKIKHTPIIMVTAKSEESDIVLGLGVGADDYIAKPFKVREVVARVRAVLRGRAIAADGDAEEPNRLEIQGVVIDSDRFDVSVDGESAQFTATEFRMAYFLATHPGRVYTREQLIDHVLGHDAMVSDRNIDVHIRSVRQKLGPYRDLVETVRGVGYRFQDYR